MSHRYLEDFVIGQTFGSGQLLIEKERARAFALEFDPQPFHLDEEAAQRTIFGGLAASGWHTAAVTMRLLVESWIRRQRSTAQPFTASMSGRRESRSRRLRNHPCSAGA